MADLNGMTETMFREMAVNAVINYWNNSPFLTTEYGSIGRHDVYITWQCKAIENFKALLGVSREGDDMYFEFTLHAAKNQCYLDVYHKETQVVVPLN